MVNITDKDLVKSETLALKKYLMARDLFPIDQQLICQQVIDGINYSATIRAVKGSK